MPLVPAGLNLFNASISDRKFSLRASSVKEARPIVHWTMPALSARYGTCPAFAFFTASATFGVTVPTFGFGIRPRGPRIWPSWPTTRIASGLATTTSKFISPAFTFSARSSRPTTSAPAARAASWFLPPVNTATRTDLPMPCGITVEPRTCWSDFDASMPRLIATSTDSLNFALANSLTSASASSIGYCLPGWILPVQAFTRLATNGMSEALHVDAHAARAARDRADGGFEVGSGQIRLLDLGDVFELRAVDASHLVGVRRAAALLDADGLADQHRGRRRLQNEGEAAIAVHGDHHRRRQPLLQALRLRVERLAELHDVHALLTERRTDRRARIRLACRNLQLDVASNFLGHVCLSGCKRCGSRSSPSVNYKEKIRPFRPDRNPIPRASSGRESAPPPAGGSSRSSPTPRRR